MKKNKEESLLQYIHKMWERVMPMRKEYWERLLEDTTFIDDFFENNKRNFLQNKSKKL